MEVTLEEMLAAREQRAAEQQRLLAQYRKTLVCFTLNIPGPVKTAPDIVRAFGEGLAALDHRLPRGSVLYRSARTPFTGCQAFYVVDRPPQAVKKICMDIEEGCPLGRLFDMDVLTPEGVKLDRPAGRAAARGCIVCGAPGRDCAARRLHSVDQLQKAARGIVEAHFARADGQRIASLAVGSLLDEVATTPKPGLVDRANTGSHRDMDIFTFNASAAALYPYFLRCFELGRGGREQPREVLFDALREAGLQAEVQMYAATGGVNTHKGMIYTLGILCGAWGRLWTAAQPSPGAQALCRACGALAAASAGEDLRRIAEEGAADTAGARLYRSQGLTGIRGEAAAGLPSVTRWALPAYRQALDGGRSRNDAGAAALIHLIAHVDDTNLYHRGGRAGALWAAQAARELLDRSPLPTPAEIARLDEEFIRRDLSPGGCADLLAVTYFLDGADGLRAAPQGQEDVKQED